MVMLNELLSVFDVYNPSTLIHGAIPVHSCQLCGAAVMDVDGSEAMDPNGPMMRHIDFHRRNGDL